MEVLEEIVAQWIPWIALAISILTFALTVIKFGREVHVDDKREMLRRIDDCERNHRACVKENEELRKRLEASEQEKIRYMKLYLNSNGKGEPKP